MAKAAKTAAVIARDAKKRKSLRGWRVHGTAQHAAEACGVGYSTVRDWHRNDPEYRQQVAEAIDEYAETAGRETHNALLEHVRSAARGDMVLTKSGTEGGKETTLHERVALNPAVARLLLTRADPRFTHPKQEVEHSGSVSMGAALDAIRERMAGGDDDADTSEGPGQ